MSAGTVIGQLRCSMQLGEKPKFGKYRTDITKEVHCEDPDKFLYTHSI